MQVKRKFLSGEEWIYFKIYCSSKSTDEILTSDLFPELEMLKAENYIRSWFYIRYYDVDHHLRLRLRLADERDLFKVITSLNKIFSNLMENNIVWKVQQDTYVRELERYGNHLIIPSEEIFYWDSQAILKGIQISKNQDDQNLRWLFALLIIDSIMEDFEFNRKDKKELIGILQNSFGKEMGLDKNLKKTLNKKYRTHTAEITSVLNQDIKSPHSRILYEIINQKSKMLKNSVKEIQKVNLPKMNLYSLVASHIHMSMNRLFPDRNRQSEFVCYYFLFTFYNSLLAREKYQKSPIAS